MQNAFETCDKFSALFVRTVESPIVSRVMIAAQPQQILRMVIVALAYGIKVRSLTSVFVPMANRALAVRFIDYFTANARRNVGSLSVLPRPGRFEPVVELKQLVLLEEIRIALHFCDLQLTADP